MPGNRSTVLTNSSTPRGMKTWTSAAGSTPRAGRSTSPRKQTFQNIGIHIFDNASSDDTLKVVSSFDIDYLKHSPVNTGFCRAHNDLIRCFPSEYVLFLNPDTILQSVFIEELVRALDARPDAASASGKLLRLDGKTLDSTGIIMLREQRHLDRGADQIDEGQFE